MIRAKVAARGSVRAGAGSTALREWVKRADVDAGDNPSGALTTDERAELSRLRPSPFLQRRGWDSNPRYGYPYT
jgi:transposase-like protein